MTEPSDVEELKESISKWRASGERFVPQGLRERIVAYARDQVKSGATRRGVATELGLNEGTLAWWLGTPSTRRGGRRGVFQPVRVIAPEAERGVVVHGPAGVRIEGLSVQQAAELILKLS